MRFFQDVLLFPLAGIFLFSRFIARWAARLFGVRLLVRDISAGVFFALAVAALAHFLFFLLIRREWVAGLVVAPLVLAMVQSESGLRP